MDITGMSGNIFIDSTFHQFNSLQHRLEIMKQNICF